jgi:hypothetical protein
MATLRTRGMAPRMEFTTSRSLGYRAMRRRGRSARRTCPPTHRRKGGGVRPIVVPVRACLCNARPFAWFLSWDEWVAWGPCTVRALCSGGGGCRVVWGLGVGGKANLSPTLPSFSLPNPILYLGIPCALVKLME